jgi:hypothetical protein
MKRIAVVTAVIAVLLLIDGTYLQLTNNEVGGDSGVLFGNPNLFLSAGTVVLISGGLMLVGAGLMWAVAVRRQRRVPAGAAGVSQPPAQAVAAAQPKPGTSVAAAQAQTGKGTDHQRQP